MANKPNTGRPVAPGVDPLTPVQDPHTLGQDTPAAPAVGTQNDQSPVLTKQDDPKALPGNGASAEVEMISVRTKGDFILMDPWSARHVDRNGAEVPVTTFITDQLAEGGRLEKA